MAWLIVAVCGVIIFLIGTTIQSELAPMEDKSSIRLQMTTPEGSSYNFTKGIAERVMSFVNDSVAESDFTFVAAPGFGGSGNNSASGSLGLTEQEKGIVRKMKLPMISIKNLPVLMMPEFLQCRNKPFLWVLVHEDHCLFNLFCKILILQSLKKQFPYFWKRHDRDKTFQNVDVNLKFNTPQLTLTVDRIKARDLGLSTADVAGAVQAAFSGRRLAYFIMNGKQYQVIGQVERKDRNQPADIERLYVTNAAGEDIPLSP